LCRGGANSWGFNLSAETILALAALTASTRDQQESLSGTEIGVRATKRDLQTGNLSSIVDIEWIQADYVQVDDRPLVPQNGPRCVRIAVERLPNDLALRVDCPRNTEAIAGQGSEIGDRSLAPQSRMESIARGSTADYFTCVIDPVCE